MQGYQQEAINDQKQLDKKRDKLRQFIMNTNKTNKFNELSDEEKSLLAGQLQVMSHYSDILGRRIAAFE